MQSLSFSLSPLFKQRAFFWAKSFPFIAHLDSNQYSHDRYSRFDAVIAIGKANTNTLSISSTTPKTSISPFEALKTFHQQSKHWLYGYLSYDLKNAIENLSSQNNDNLNFPDLFFFKASIRILFTKDGQILIESQDIQLTPQLIYQQIQATSIPSNLHEANQRFEQLSFKSRLSYESYIQQVQKIKTHILRGDIYEANFCQEFYVDQASIDPYATFWQLNQAAKAPFSAFLALQDHFALSISPERYLQKQGQKVISQPIKGTIKRGNNLWEDQLLQARLLQSKKDRSENVMIVDLVRNDLSKVAQWGTVKVEELYGIYGFSAVFHLISTISAQLKDQYHFVDLLKATFPMGSMTGAPKISAMQLMEIYEASKRGLYSGAIGYISPEGDFDFNVVIRSLLYSKKKQYLSLQAGGAITAESDPQKEYEESLLKIHSLTNALYYNKVSM